MGKIIYDEEFKKTIVSLADSGKTVLELSTEYSVSLASVHRCKKQYSKDKNTVLSSEKVESTLKIKSLEKELKEIKLERDILKKAVSIFSKNN